MFERSLEEQQVKYRVMTFSSINSLRECAVRGIGVTVCPEVAVRHLLQQGDLEKIAIALPDTSVIMIRHLQKWCSPLLQRLMQLVEERLG